MQNKPYDYEKVHTGYCDGKKEEVRIYLHGLREFLEEIELKYGKKMQIEKDKWWESYYL